MLVAQQLHFARKPVHPFLRFFWEVNCGSDALMNCNPFFSGDQVVGVRDDLLFGCPGHAVAGKESEERAFVSSEPGPCVAFDDAG